MTYDYAVGNWYKMKGDNATALKMYQGILESPYWNAWDYVVTDRELSRRKKNINLD